MTESDPPKIRIDWEIFHPLDHRIGSRQCRSFQTFPLNVRLHWQYQQDFGPYSLRSFFRRLFFCPLGAHQMGGVYKGLVTEGRMPEYYLCWNCSHQEPNQ